MKRLLLTAIATGFCVCSYAQTEKGKVILGGSIGFNSAKLDGQMDQKETSLNIGPAMGLFVGENVALGLGLEYSANKTNPQTYTVYFDGIPYVNGSSGNKGESIGVNPFFRYYWNLNDRVKLFGQANAGASFGKGKMLNIDGTDGEKNKSTTFSSSIQPGIAFFPTKKIAIELKVPLFYYMHQKVDYNNSDTMDMKYNQFSFGSDLIKPVLGINFHF